MTRYNYNDYDPDRDEARSQRTEQGSTPKSAPPRRPAAEPRQRNSSSRNSTTSPSIFKRIALFCTSKRTKIVTGIALFLLTIWLAVAALSFLKSNKADQSAIVSPSIESIADPSVVIENVTGPGGANVSHHLFVEGLGFGSIVLIIYIAIVALALFDVLKISFWKLTFKSLILSITISMILGLVFINSEASIPPGGYHGHYINEWLINNIGWIGAVLVSVLLASIVVTVFINELLSIYNRYKEKVRTLRDRKILEDDRRGYVSEQIEEALSDSPLATVTEGNSSTTESSAENSGKQQRQEISIELENLPEVTTDDEDININVADEIAKRDNVNPTDSSTKSTVTEASNATSSIVTATEATTNTQVTTGSQPLEPEFEIAKEKEIEQGSGLPSKLSAEGPYDPRADLSGFRMPPLSLMIDRPGKSNCVDLTEQEENKERITKTLEQYNIKIDKIKATVGPTVTLYEIVPAEGVRIAAIKRLEDDIAMSLAALGIRIIAPIPGHGTIGIEVPNKDPQTVPIRSILGSKAFQESKFELPMALGASISNDVFMVDLAKMPHLLVAGATGQGKSVGLNTIIASLLYKKHPAELKFVLVDPKMVEFSLYACLEKHYLAKLPGEEDPVITDPSKVVDTLNSLCMEMDDRYSLLKDAGCRSIIEYNTKFINRRLNPENGHRYMPYIVMIVDEFADLIMMAGKAVETPIARIAQKARAVGMHMIIATQRPSTNVITGLIKANFPARIGFRVSSMVDSRTILDSPGANQLIGRGDMLISQNGTMERVQCAFIDTPEVEALCNHIRDQIGYPTAYVLPEPPQEAGDEMGGGSGMTAERDPLLEEVGRWIVQGNTASTSSVQRRYSIGYNRAGKIMDQLESLGVVDRAQGGKPRRVLVDPMTLEDIFSTFSR